MSSRAYFYKVGFLAACADHGLDAEQAEELAARKLASLTGLQGLALAPLALAAGGLGVGGLLGAAGGYAAGSATNGDPNVPTSSLKADRLNALAAEARRRKQLLGQNPGLFS